MPATCPSRVVALLFALGSCLSASAWGRTQPSATPSDSPLEEFCLIGEFNLGARLQGLGTGEDEFYPARMCVTSSDISRTIQFHGAGHSNPDMEESFTVRYELPDTVRIVGDESSPDIVFRGADIAAEARRNRRLDPQRLVSELERNPDWIVSRDDQGWLELALPQETARVRVLIEDHRLQKLETHAELPLRGRVPVRWNWRWPTGGSSEPEVELTVDASLMLRARGERRRLTAEETAELTGQVTARQEREAPARNWPALIDMWREALAEGVWMVRGVRTGFHHLVVETNSGLIVADAPAGWVEMQQIPPADLVPGLGISGLSERFTDFLRENWPNQPIRAVALTHVHDDHAGGARAFAAEGASVYAPAEIAEFLEGALQRTTMPTDRLAAKGGAVEIRPVRDRLVLEDEERTVELLPLGAGPHVSAALGVWVPDAGIFFQSDLLVPRTESDEPRPDRAGTECWFARWAVSALPQDAVVVNSHSTARVPVARLQRYTQSDLCQD